MRRALGLSILLLLFAESFSSRSHNDVQSCLIREDVKCGERACSCEKYLTFDPRTWTAALQQLFTSTKRCKCDVYCSRAKEVKCLHGRCMNRQRGCRCLPCWTGPQCDRYVNKHPPKFEKNYLGVKIHTPYYVGQIVTTLKVKDGDSVLCTKREKCPCAESRFEIIAGDENKVFKIETGTGKVILAKAMEEKTAKLQISVKNLAENSTSTTRSNSIMTLEIFNMGIQKWTGSSHRLVRRATGQPHSLMLSIKPVISTKYYFDVGDKIYFSVILSHNTSVTTINSAVTNIDLTSTYLTLALVSRVDPSTVFVSTSGITNGIRINLSKLHANQHFTANVSGEVKNTIGPLSNLFLTGNVETAVTGGTGNLKNIKSSPVVYSVFPTVNLTRDVVSGMNVYENATFTMKMQFPKLNFFLLAELTTNIEDFVFMKLKNAKVKNKGSAVSYNGSAVAAYHKSTGSSFTDRVVVDFGYLQCSSNTDNQLDIEFQLEVRDHVKLVNNSKHWMGVGLQAGYRVLWVEQQALMITKNEPTLSLELTSPNTSSLTRFYIGDVITINYRINHTNTSYTTAHNLGIVCSFTHLEAIGNLQVVSAGVNRVPDATGTLAHGSSKMGSFTLKVKNTITPLVELGIQCNLSYTNVAAISKIPVSTTMSPALLAGTPSIILGLQNASDNNLYGGRKRTFKLMILLTKMISPLRIELVTPTANNESILTITKVNKAVIGSKITGYNASAVPEYRPGVVYKKDYSTVIYDLGTASNPTGDSNVPENQIQLTFDVYFSDQAGTKNGTKYWVGAGVVGKPRMIWVGQIALTPIFKNPIDAVLQLSTTVQNSGATVIDYVTSVKHLPISQRWAFNLTVNYFLPSYITFKALTNKPVGLVHQQKDGYMQFKSEGPFLFYEYLNFTFQVNIDKSKAPHGGRVNVLVPVYLSYTDRNAKESTVVKATHTYFDMPPVPPVTPKPSVKPAAKYYKRGFFIHMINEPSTYHIYVCIDQRFPVTMSACYSSEDKGATWKGVDNRVASIVSVDSKGNLYGVARNKVAYLKFDSIVKDWVSVDAIDESGTGYLHSSDAANNVSPAEDRKIGGDAWGASKDGLHFKPSAGSWTLKANWL